MFQMMLMFAIYCVSGYNKSTCKTLYLMDPEKINFELIEHVLVWTVNGSHDFPRKGSILVCTEMVFCVCAWFSLLFLNISEEHKKAQHKCREVSNTIFSTRA